MFKQFKSIFAPQIREPENAEATARRAAAALLAEAGLSDGEYAPEEKAVAAAALARLYGLDAEAARKLVDDGETAAHHAVGQHRFAEAMKAATSVRERADFLAEVWRVVLADGRRDPHEDAFMRKLAGLLYVPDRESGLARRRALDED